MIQDKLRQVYGLDKYGSKIPEWTEDLKYEFVKEVIGNKIYEAREWINNMNKILEELKDKVNVKGWIFSREMTSFIKDPYRHLVKKLFIYFHDLLRGRITVEEFITKGKQAINSSFSSNMRSIYQIWGFSSIILLLGDYGFNVVYPEHKYLNFDRSGKQKLGIIPPNVVLQRLSSAFSFFLEAPRPIAWEDGSDLERVWRLYSTLRPDMMIYRGFQIDILDLENSDIPIKRPSYILEFKELDNWWKRWRYLKEYKPLSGNEWRARWIKGLYNGLVEVLNKLPEDLPDFKDSKSKRIREYEIIYLYNNIYKPKDKGVLASRVTVSEEIKTKINNEIMVIDNIAFNYNKFEDLVDDMLRGNVVGKGEVDVTRLAYKFALERKDEFLKWLKNQGIDNIDLSNDFNY
ncbi:hypothetical protein [Saccharolobus sp. A20]|uniref:hypothetical protein n=1 Tax=Saccharolobus sp. A20 TaxID=1891280 RepID=UPI000845C656|nr:hypothetical protein [Sulfolobus sp. A20]